MNLSNRNNFQLATFIYMCWAFCLCTDYTHSNWFIAGSKRVTVFSKTGSDWSNTVLMDILGLCMESDISNSQRSSSPSSIVNSIACKTHEDHKQVLRRYKYIRTQFSNYVHTLKVYYYNLPIIQKRFLSN